MSTRQQNAWPFSSPSAQDRAELRSGWSIGRAVREAEAAGYSGRLSFGDWLKRNKLDDRSTGQVSLLRRAYGEGVEREGVEAGRKVAGARERAEKAEDKRVRTAPSGVEDEVYSALRNMGATTGVAREAARAGVSGGGGFDQAFKRAVDIMSRKGNPTANFTTRRAAEQYVRLLESEGKRAKVVPGFGEWYVKVEEKNGVNPGEYKLYTAIVDFVATDAGHKTKVKAGSTWEALSTRPYVSTAGPYWKLGERKGNRWGSRQISVPVEYMDGRIFKETGENPRHRRNPESTAADMYESFHGAPSEQLVTFEEEEHYHEYLAELGVCCGVVVECEDGQVRAIGLSGYNWKGKGKEAGFVGGVVRENPRRGRYQSPGIGPVDYFKPRFVPESLLPALSNMWHLSRTAKGNDRHARLVWTAREFSKEHPEAGSETAVYKDLTGMLEHGMNPRRGKRKGPIGSSMDMLGGMAEAADGALGRVLGNPSDTTIAEIRKRGLEAIRAKQPYVFFIINGRESLLKTMSMSADQWKNLTMDRVVRMKVNGAHHNPADAVDPSTTLLSSNEDGTQLYLVGGDQSLDLDSLSITDAAATKELISVGAVIQIWYATAKDFDKFEEIHYHHDFGEESGELPVLAYDRMNQRLLLVGGAYRIEKPWGETSPGIEN